MCGLLCAIPECFRSPFLGGGIVLGWFGPVSRCGVVAVSCAYIRGEAPRRVVLVAARGQQGREAKRGGTSHTSRFVVRPMMAPFARDQLERELGFAGAGGERAVPKSLGYLV